ncbi:MAG: DUF302 domain-containing protein [Thiotrichaceae bacterium]
MKPLITFISLLSLWLFSVSALADSGQVAKSSSDIVKKESPYSVNETMDKFEAIVKKKGLGVFVRVDHKKNAQSVDLDMNEAQVLIFGNPQGGTLVMKQDMAASLDLPLRVAVYKGSDNKVYIAYHKPTGLADHYKLEGNKVLPKVTGALDKLTSAAIK